MKIVQFLVFRYLTHAEFFNMYKPSGTEVGGGGQSYIDFPTKSVSSENWDNYFSGIPSEERTQGPSWTFEINSIGVSGYQSLIIFQRREQSFSISSQKMTSNRANRVLAWHPQNGFPEPVDPTNRNSCPPGLAIYIVRTNTGEFWAGWFRDNSPCRDPQAQIILHNMLSSSTVEGYAGFIQPNTMLYLDETDINTPFYTIAVQSPIIPIPQPIQIPQTPVPTPKSFPISPKAPKSEDEITKALFDEDEGETNNAPPQTKEVIARIRSRNAKSVKSLKELYQGKCQITGDEYTFLKKDNTPYCEAHHLIPLGLQGADSPFNIIIVSPLIHKMLHYADVSPIDISKMTGTNTLQIFINNEPYTITWHAKHADNVKSHQDPSS